MILERYLSSHFRRNLIFLIATALSYSAAFLVQIHYTLFYEVSMAIFCFTALMILGRPLNGVLVLTFFAILSDTHYLYGFELFQSIYTVKLGGLNLIDILLLLLVARTSLDFLAKKQYNFRILWWDRSFFVVIMLVVLGAIYGLFYSPDMSNWLVDLKVFGYLIVPYVLVRFLLQGEDRILSLFKTVFFAFAAKLVVYSGLFFSKFGDVGPDMIRVTLSSDVVVYTMLALLALAVLRMAGNLSSKVLFSALGVLAAFQVIFSFGRETWVWSAVSLAVFLFLIERHYRLRLLRFASLGLVLSLSVAALYYPSLFTYMQYNVDTFSLSTKPVQGEASGAVRTIEWINISHLLSDNYALLQGMGLGATWTDSYFPLPKKRDPFSFPTEEEEHVFTHTVFSRYFLKLGIVGSLIFWAAISFGWLQSVRFAIRLDDSDRYFLLAIMVGAISLIAKVDLVRIGLFAGLTLGLVANYIDVLRNHNLSLRTAE